MAAERITVGNVEILSLSDCILEEIDACSFFPGKNADSFDIFGGVVDEDCKIHGGINVGIFLIQSQGRRILVDAGVGPGPLVELGNVKGNLPKELAAHGLSLEEIDTVVVTHMHMDHMGWLAPRVDGRVTKTFPNAKYIIPKADWELVLSPDQVKKPLPPNHFSKDAVKIVTNFSHWGRDISQVEGVELVSGEFQVSDEVTTVPTPGHTPGHQSLLITSQGERAFVLGDVAHIPFQVEAPDWIAFADVQPELGRKTRVETMEWLEREGLLVAAGHFPAPGFGRVVRGDARRYWQSI